MLCCWLARMSVDWRITTKVFCSCSKSSITVNVWPFITLLYPGSDDTVLSIFLMLLCQFCDDLFAMLFCSLFSSFFPCFLKNALLLICCCALMCCVVVELTFSVFLPMLDIGGCFSSCSRMLSSGSVLIC